MFDTIAILLVVVNTTLLVIVFLRLQASASKRDIRNVIHLIRLGREKALVADVEKVKKGSTKDEVEKLLGEPDSPNNGEWVYYLDDHSGYVIAYDGASRVESVSSFLQETSFGIDCIRQKFNMLRNFTFFIKFNLERTYPFTLSSKF